MIRLFLACSLFLGLHLGVAGTPLRGRIVARTGENAYRGLFALAALVSLILICLSYGPAFASAGNTTLFEPPQGWRNMALPVVGFAFLLGMPGFLMANPTSAGQEGATLYGMQRITRHPFLWGAAIWAAFHLTASGDLASTILFVTFLILPLAGTKSIDSRARIRLGDAGWNQLAGASSNLPFAAIVTGKTRFIFREICDWRLAVSIAILLMWLYFHAKIFGITPFPNGWMPSF